MQIRHSVNDILKENPHIITKNIIHKCTCILSSDLKADKITKRNAIRKLESLYLQISENVAVKDFTIDDKGNIELKDYDEQTKDQEQNKDDQER